MNNDDRMFLNSLKRELNAQDCNEQRTCYWTVIERRPVPVRSSDANDWRIIDDGIAYEAQEFIDRIRKELYPCFTDSQKKEWNTITEDTGVCREDNIVEFLNGYGFYNDLYVVRYTDDDIENYDGGIFLTENDCNDWIRRNSHNLVNPRPYKKTMHDNPVMSRLVDIVRKTDWI